MHQGITKGGSITVPLTSCLTGLESAVWQLAIFVLFAKQTNPNQSNGGQWYSDTSPFSIPWMHHHHHHVQPNQTVLHVDETWSFWQRKNQPTLNFSRIFLAGTEFVELCALKTHNYAYWEWYSSITSPNSTIGVESPVRNAFSAKQH